MLYWIGVGVCLYLGYLVAVWGLAVITTLAQRVLPVLAPSKSTFLLALVLAGVWTLVSAAGR